LLWRGSVDAQSPMASKPSLDVTSGRLRSTPPFPPAFRIVISGGVWVGDVTRRCNKSCAVRYLSKRTRYILQIVLKLYTDFQVYHLAALKAVYSFRLFY
jgi:hypothetical protein